MGEPTKLRYVFAKFLNPLNSFGRDSVNECSSSARPVVIYDIPDANNEGQDNAEAKEDILQVILHFLWPDA